MTPYVGYSLLILIVGFALITVANFTGDELADSDMIQFFIRRSYYDKSDFGDDNRTAFLTVLCKESFTTSKWAQT